MKITVGNETYSSIKDLSFAPVADVTGDSLPINEFSAEIITDDDIAVGATAQLYDDLDNMWASYTVSFSERTNAGRKIIAQSVISILSKRTRDLAFYDEEPVTNILNNIFLGLPAYSLDPSLTNEKISGYVPEQTCRERLQWICLVLGAYVKSFGSGTIQILPLSDNETYIPINKTYWRPEHNHKDYVTTLRVMAYTYTEGEPEVTDEWISDGTGSNFYIQTYQDYTLQNSAAPPSVPANEVVVKDITIINPSNVSKVLTTLAAYHFNRDEVVATVVNNWDYKPGEKVTVHVSEDETITGYIKTALFTFGLEARSTIQLVMTAAGDAGALIVNHKFEGITLLKEVYHFPVGYEYEFDNKFIDTYLNNHRYVLRPVNAKITGTMTSGTTTKNEPHAVALDYFENVLHIVSVDDSTESTAGEVEIS